MKKLKRILTLTLAMLLVLCIQLSSVAFAATTDTAQTGEDDIPLEVGDILLYYVDLTSARAVKELTATIKYDPNVVQLLTNIPDAMPYINRKYEPPMESTENGDGTKFSVSLPDTATQGMDFSNGERFLQLKFKLLRKTFPEIDLFFDWGVSMSGSQLIFAGVHELDVSYETTLQFTDNGNIPISFCDIQLDKSFFTYDGTEKRPVLTVKHGAHTLVPGTDYIWAYENNINPGTASVHIIPLGEYTGFSVVNYTIAAPGVTSVPIDQCDITLSETSVVYNGIKHEPEVTVKNGNTLLIPSVDYTVAYSDNVNVGQGMVFIFGQGSYTGVAVRTFDITSAESKKVSISSCSVTMDTTFSYTGSAITPAVTVSYNGKQLTKGTDYTVTYSNNIQPGTATATITGIGNYTDSRKINFTIKEAEQKKVSISDCSITLDKSVFTYDGTAKKPVVTVKHGNTTLSQGTDYTVSYSNNTNIGNATVTITGKGNYSGSVSKGFSIQAPQNTGFTWGVDNWNFNNSAPTYFPKTSYRQHINNTYLNELKKNLTNSEYYVVFEARNNLLDSQFGGSCYGMSSTALLAKEGLLPFANYQSGATKLTDLGAPVNNKEVSSLVTYYQMLQVKDIIQQQYRTLPSQSNEVIINRIMDTLDENTTCIVGFKKNGWGGHAILAYGYEFGSWTFNGITYDGCIKICDPNRSTGYDKEANIYFNTKTYSWAIPLYSYAPISSAAGAVFNYVGADIDEINEGGYLSGSSTNKAMDYVARIDALSISENRAVSKVVGANGIYMNQAAGPGEIVEDYSYIVGGESVGTAGYNLFDADAAYKVVQDTPVELALSMDYEDCYLSATSMAGTSVLFDREGFVEVKGESANFNISMTFDNNYPTSWFTINVDGTGANTASLQQVEDGYILTSDNLNDIDLKANNKTMAATASFSTNYDSVFIYEINENTIGVKVDTDDNGTYETELEVENGSTFSTGDANMDGDINIKDATAIQKHIAMLEILSAEAKKLADYDADTVITIKDATAIQKKIAGLI